MIHYVASGLFILFILNQANFSVGNAGIQPNDYSNVKQLSNKSIPIENVSINLNNRF